MNEHVNLLSNAGGRNYANIITRLRVLRLVAVGLLFVIGTFSIMLFLIIAFSPLPRLRQEEQRYIADLNAGEYREKMDKYYFINSRLGDISKLLSERPNIIASYELTEGAFTTTTTVNFLDITDNTITLSISSPNLADIEQAVAIVNQKAKNNTKIKALTLSSISYDIKENAYEMVMTITQA